MESEKSVGRGMHIRVGVPMDMIMHVHTFENVMPETSDGALLLLGGGSVVAAFAPGHWSYWSACDENGNHGK